MEVWVCKTRQLVNNKTEITVLNGELGDCFWYKRECVGHQEYQYHARHVRQ